MKKSKKKRKKKILKHLVPEITKRLAHVNLMYHQNKVMDDDTKYSRKDKHKKIFNKED